MTLRDREFERRLSTRVRAALRASPALCREYRRVRKSRTDSPLANWLVGLFSASALANLFYLVVAESGRLDLGLGLLAWFCVGLLSYHGRRLEAALADPGTLAVFAHLPMTDRMIFAAQGRRFWIETLAGAGWFLPAGIALAVAVKGSAWLVMAAVLLPPVQYLLAATVAVHLETWRPAGPHRRLGFLMLATVVLTMSWRRAGEWLDPIVAVAPWLPPFGWLNHAFSAGAVAGDWLAISLVIPAAVSVWCLPWSWSKLADGYYLGERADSGPDGVTAESPMGAAGGRMVPTLGPTELAERVMGRGFLQPLIWARLGWLERWTARCLTQRQRLVAEFLLAGVPNWRKRLTWAVGVAGVSAAAIAVVGRPIEPFAYFLAFLVGAACFPFLTSTWPGLATGQTGTVFAPLYSGYPITTRELAAVLLKVDVARCLAAAPIWVAFVGFADWRLHGSVGAVTIGALKVLGLVLVLQPGVVGMRLGGGMGGPLRWTSVLLWLPVFAVVVGLAFWLFAFSETAFQSAMLLLAEGMLAAAVLAGYVLGNNRGWFDPLRPVPGEASGATE